jgi:membrane protein DedA with SNARE-associated domain
MSTIVAEAPTLGHILHNVLDGLAWIGILVLLGVASYSQWREDFERRNIALFALIALIICWFILGATLFHAAPAENPLN